MNENLFVMIVAVIIIGLIGGVIALFVTGHLILGFISVLLMLFVWAGFTLGGFY
jgi:hypothetical protein